MANTPSEHIAVGGAAVAKQHRLLFFYYLFFNFIGMMLTPYPPLSLLLLTPTTGRLMIASRARRRF